MENRILTDGLNGRVIIVTGEITETASVRQISKKLEGALPDDGNIYYHEITPNCLALISSVDVFIGNRVIGTGLDEKASESLIEKLKNFYRRNNKSKFFIQVSPVENNAGIAEMLLNNGAELRSSWVKLVKIPESKKADQNEIVIGELQDKDRDIIATLLLKSFSFPEELRTFCNNAFGRPGWKNYVAWINDKITGTGSLYIRNGIAEIGIAATAEEIRGKGVQSALIDYRENEAFIQGCKYMFVETAEPTPTYSAPSYRNMIRLGFTELYRRPNFLFTL